MKSFFLALSLLTRIPVPFKLYDGIKKSSSATRYFPFVGLVIGLIVAVIAYVLAPLLPVWPFAVLMSLCLAGFSGFLHLDGVADCADGFLSSRPTERILEIMKDSRIGAMGTLALIFVVLMKVSLIGSLVQSQKLESLAMILLLCPLAGRCAILWHMWCTPVIGDGLGKSFWDRSYGIQFMALLLFGLVHFYLMPERLVMNVSLLIFVTILGSFYCRSKIKGGTGDTLGVACELGEITLLLGFVL